MNKILLAHYQQNRAHQVSVWADGGGMITTDPNGRVEMSYGSAAYGFHAAAALQSARSHIHFRKTLAADIKGYKKRSAAAKRGWKTRRAG